MPLMLESTTLLNDNTIDLIIGVGTVYLTLTNMMVKSLKNLMGDERLCWERTDSRI